MKKMNRKILDTIKLLGVIIFMLIVVLLALFVNKNYASEPKVLALIVGGVIAVSYIWFLNFLRKYLNEEKDRFWLVPVMYSFMVIVIAGLFSLLVGDIGRLYLAEKMTGDVWLIHFYYCVMSLTTVGYGDVRPIGESGYILSIYMSLIGTVHMLMFIVMLMEKLKQVPEKK